MINDIKQYGDIIEHANLENYNTYHVKSSVKYLITPNSINDLVSIISILKDNNIKFTVIGNGSNIVLNDKEYDGAFIKLSKLNGVVVYPEMQMAYAEAGAKLPRLVKESVDNSLTGIEFAAGIPGTVGGAIYGNAGAYNACILDYVESVTVLDDKYDVKILDHESISYGYRTSMFKESKKYIILAAKFYLKQGDKANSRQIIEERKLRRIETQPLDLPSAGSVFRNPEGDSAGRIIESCNLKGKRIGGAVVSSKHANFIVNDGNASGEDIYNLIKYVHDEVLKITNVDLLVEQEFIGWE